MPSATPQEAEIAQKNPRKMELSKYNTVMSLERMPTAQPLNPKNSADREKLTQLIEATIAESRYLISASAISANNLSNLDQDLLARAMRLVTEANDLLILQRNKIQSLENMVTHDDMTGLLNRRGFEEQLARELSRVRRGQSKGCTMALFDLDGFKSINDNHGHPAGDAAIRKVGDFFQRTIRETDIVARMGGDEFALVLTDIDDDQAQTRAAKVSEQLDKLSIEWNNNVIPLHGSYGLSRSVREDQFDRLYRAADEALYRSKLHRKKA
jgi:diguanylate cyclase (GGDEF)-like protein